MKLCWLTPYFCAWTHKQLETTQRDQALWSAFNASGGLPVGFATVYYWLGASVAEVAALLDVPGTR